MDDKKIKTELTEKNSNNINIPKITDQINPFLKNVNLKKEINIIDDKENIE